MANWTPTQRDAIESVGKNLLVSAAAGSGKTSVLTQRCVHLVCDVAEPCDVGELLVVTYTEAAAAEMKSRFARALAERYAANPDERIGKQLAMVDRAYIGTLHGFCARVLRRHFNQIGLDPGFRILDPDEASLLRTETAEKLFADRYADEPDDFRNFVESYSAGDDKRLIWLVLRSHDLLGSVIRPAEWLRKSSERIARAIELPLAESDLGRALLDEVQSGIDGVLQRCDTGLAAIGSRGPLGKYHSYLADIRRAVEHIRDVFLQYGVDAAAEELASLEFPRLPTVSGEVPGKERGKQLIDDVRDNIKEGAWRKSLAFTEAEWIDGLKKIQPHLEVLLKLLAEFSERFSAAKLEEGALDFADLERMTLRCLTDTNADGQFVTNNIARGYQSAIKHVLVDEYQDINPVQDTILALVSHERSKLVPNLFCVGDVKQSIYRFRLADPAQFLNRRARYLAGKGGGRVIDLQQNFRSRAPLLDVVNTLFTAVMSREATDLDYDDSQMLKAGATFPPTVEGAFAGAPVELHILDAAAAPVDPEEDLGRIEVEAVLIGQRIFELTGRAGKPARMINDRGTYRAARVGDCVVLLRSLKSKADPVAAVLRRMGIPVFNESKTGYFTATEINDVLSTLHLLDNVRQDIPLAAFLRGPIAKLDDAESAMATIRLVYPESAFHAAVWRYVDEQSGELAEKLRGLRDQLSAWRQIAREQPVSELIRVLYEQTGLLTFMSGLPGGQQRVANLLQLQERAAQFSAFRRQGLSRFLAFLEKLKDQSDLGQATISSEAEDVVRIMSIHGSKGLEFPVVIVPDLGKGINFTEERSSIVVDRDFGFGLAVVDEERECQYPSLAAAVVKQRLHHQTVAEETRVLYVATTRAREHLILIGTATNVQVQKWRAAMENPPGPLSPEMVMAANCPLDWIAPAAFRADPGMFTIVTPTDAPSGEIGAMPGRENALTDLQQARADLLPIEPKPELSATAAAMIARVTAGYTHHDAATRAAVASVTSLVKKTPAAGDGGAGPASSVLELPLFLGAVAEMSAADRGTATHAVLEFLKLEDADSAGAIRGQIDRFVSERRLTAEEADQVDVDAILWMMNQDVGRLLRDHAANVKREVPIYFDTGDTAVDPMDRQMVRGRIDLMVDHAGGWTIVDYKTDRVHGEKIDDRVEIYAGQLKLYAAAVRRITGKPVNGATLVFLTPRQVREVRVAD
jgi:ATP-dependent helicase/nuclease subunit A